MASETSSISRITVFGYAFLSMMSLVVGLCVLQANIAVINLILVPFAAALGIVFLLCGFLSFKDADVSHSAGFFALFCLVGWSALAFSFFSHQTNSGAIVASGILCLVPLIAAASICVRRDSEAFFVLLLLVCLSFATLLISIGAQDHMMDVLISIFWFATSILAAVFCFIPETEFIVIRSKAARLTHIGG